MSWLDILIILFIYLVGYLGFRRGYTGQLFDLLTLIAAPAAAFVAAGLGSDILQALFRLDFSLTYVPLWAMTFATVGFLLFRLGLNMEEAGKKSFPRPLWRGLGALLGVIESFLLLFYILLILGNSPLSPAAVGEFKKSGMVGTIQAANTPASAIAGAIPSKRVRASVREYIRKSTFNPIFL
jgi:uncharacterized membrane protein required for colicin V production